jgi:hypothetical protein
MPHDWICSVLEDVRSYALQNGLIATAAKADETLLAARAEISGEALARPGAMRGPAKNRQN